LSPPKGSPASRCHAFLFSAVKVLIFLVRSSQVQTSLRGDLIFRRFFPSDAGRRLVASPFLFAKHPLPFGLLASPGFSYV